MIRWNADDAVSILAQTRTRVQLSGRAGTAVCPVAKFQSSPKPDPGAMGFTDEKRAIQQLVSILTQAGTRMQPVSRSPVSHYCCSFNPHPGRDLGAMLRTILFPSR